MRRIKGVDKNTIIKYSLLVLTLFLIPLLSLFFIEGTTLASKLDFLFQIQKPFLVLGVMFVILFYLTKDKKIIKKPKLNYYFLISSIILFLILSALQIPFFDALQSGLIQVTDHGIKYDKVGFLGNTFYKGETTLNQNISLMKRIYLNEIPESPKLKWYGSWLDGDNDGVFGRDFKIFLNINNHGYDITQQFSSLDQGSTGLMETTIDPQDLKIGENTLSFWIQSNKSFEAITLIKHIYYHENSFITYDNGKTWLQDDGMLLAFLEKDIKIHPIKRIIFSYKPLFVLISSILLFIGFFGLNYSKDLFKKADLEIYASAFASIGFFYGTAFIKQNWRPIANIVVSLVYALSSIFFKNVIVDITNPHCPFLVVKDFSSRICESSSGVESIGYFTLLFFLILITNWKSIDKKKTLIFYFIGLVGSVIVNTLRIFSIIMVGIYIDPEFAQGIFHTNVGWILFLIYAAAYWFLLLPYIKKKKK